MQGFSFSSVMGLRGGKDDRNEDPASLQVVAGDGAGQVQEERFYSGTSGSPKPSSTGDGLVPIYSENYRCTGVPEAGMDEKEGGGTEAADWHPQSPVFRAL